MKITILFFCIFAGFFSCVLGNIITDIARQYERSYNQIDRIADILEDWKNSDTNK